MKKHILLLTALLLISSVLFAGVPRLINYRGNLSQSGTPVTGTKSIDFQIYDALTGGNCLWDSTAKNINVYNGAFAYTLGVDAPATFSNIDWKHKDCYIQVNVGVTALSPRERIGSVGYSLVSQEAMFVSSTNVDLGQGHKLNEWISSNGLINSKKVGNISCTNVNLGAGHKLNEWVSSNGMINGADLTGTWVKIGEQSGTSLNFTNLNSSKFYKIMYSDNNMGGPPIYVQFNNNSLISYGWTLQYFFSSSTILSAGNDTKIQITPGNICAGTLDICNAGLNVSILYGSGAYGGCTYIGGGDFSGVFNSIQLYTSNGSIHAVLLELR